MDSTVPPCLYSEFIRIRLQRTLLLYLAAKMLAALQADCFSSENLMTKQSASVFPDFQENQTAIAWTTNTYLRMQNESRWGEQPPG